MAATSGLPAFARGMRIGLFGGSFNPAHDGHRLVAQESMKRLALDAVWVLVSPGNPLKDRAELAGLDARVAGAREVMDHPRIAVTSFEATRGFGYTFETVRHLRRAAPEVRFVWIMGADSLAGFHHWERWQAIAGLVPMAIYSRPGADFRAMVSPAASTLARFRIPETDAASLAGREPPAWVFLHGLTSGLSSTRLRANGHGSRN